MAKNVSIFNFPKNKKSKLPFGYKGGGCSLKKTFDFAIDCSKRDLHIVIMEDFETYKHYKCIHGMSNA